MSAIITMTRTLADAEHAAWRHLLMVRATISGGLRADKNRAWQQRAEAYKLYS